MEYENTLIRHAERALRSVTSDVRGLLCEMLGHEWLRLQGASIIFWRERVHEIEVDLFARMPKGFLAIVEVKSVVGGLWAQGRITPAQIRRLHRAAFHLSRTHGESVRVMGLFVESAERMDLFEIG